MLWTFQLLSCNSLTVLYLGGNIGQETFGALHLISSWLEVESIYTFYKAYLTAPLNSQRRGVLPLSSPKLNTHIPSG